MERTDLTPGGEWHHAIFYDALQEREDYAYLSRCFTSHPNVSLGVGGEMSGYRVGFPNPPRNLNWSVSWEVHIHRDSGWATMNLESSYTKVKVKRGTQNRVILSAKEIHQLNTMD